MASVTINLPRIGYPLAGIRPTFKRLDALMELAKESLCIKRKELERFTDGGLYPYTTFYLRDVKTRPALTGTTIFPPSAW